MEKIKKGNTTRLVDRYIQELFTKGTTYVYEGRNTENQEELTQKCMEIFIKRINSEHPKIYFGWTYVFESGFWSYKVKIND